MTYGNWDYSVFLPLLIALLSLVLFWGVHLNRAKFRWLIFWAIIFWIAASLIVLAKIYIHYFSSTKVVAIQNFWGYIVGGALTLFIPFVLILIFLFVSGVEKIALHWVMSGAIFFSFLIVLFFPSLFFTGSLIGCVIAGGKACM